MEYVRSTKLDGDCCKATFPLHSFVSLFSLSPERHLSVLCARPSSSRPSGSSSAPSPGAPPIEPGFDHTAEALFLRLLPPRSDGTALLPFSFPAISDAFHRLDHLICLPSHPFSHLPQTVTGRKTPFPETVSCSPTKLSFPGGLRAALSDPPLPLPNRVSTRCVLFEYLSV